MPAGIVPDTVKILLNIDIESTGKTRSIHNNAGRALVKKVACAWFKVIWYNQQHRCLWYLMIFTWVKKSMNRSCFTGYNQQMVSRLRPVRKMEMAHQQQLQPKKMQKKKTFGKRLVVPLDFNFFKHPVYPYGVKKYLIVCLIINSSEKVTFCSGDTAAT